MHTCADRLRQIEDLIGLLDKLELEAVESVRLEADLLVAYSLVRIEEHLAALCEARRADLGVGAADR